MIATVLLAPLGQPEWAIVAAGLAAWIVIGVIDLLVDRTDGGR